MSSGQVEDVDGIRRHDEVDGAPAAAPPSPDAARPAVDAPLGPHAASILATEHWSLLASRSLTYSESMSRAGVFLTVLSAAIVALALTADATDFGPTFSTFALFLLPAVFLLGLATYLRLVHLNVEDFQLVAAMNRLRRAYVELEPGLQRYLSTGWDDDEAGIVRTFGLGVPVHVGPANFLLTTPTIVMTIDAALVAAMAAFVLQRTGWSGAALAVAGTVTFVVVWAALFAVQLRTLLELRRDYQPRFPADEPGTR